MTTHRNKPKTNGRMPPQSCPLEVTMIPATAGEVGVCPQGASSPTLHITATGRGSHCRTRSDRFGFPRIILPRTKRVRGFQTGDIVRTPKGVGRIAVRTSGSFALKPLRGDGKPVTVNHNQCRIAQRADGYNYRPLLPALKDRVSVAQ